MAIASGARASLFTTISAGQSGGAVTYPHPLSNNYIIVMV